MARYDFPVTIGALVALSILLVGCSAEPVDPPIIVSSDMPTFLYFFTDG